VISTYLVSHPIISADPIVIIVPNNDIRIAASLISDGDIVLVGKRVVVSGPIELRSNLGTIRIVARTSLIESRAARLVSQNQREGMPVFLSFSCRYARPEWQTAQISPNLFVLPIAHRVQQVSARTAVFPLSQLSSAG
jgi:hypothetical protein